VGTLTFVTYERLVGGLYSESIEFDKKNIAFESHPFGVRRPLLKSPSDITSAALWIDDYSVSK
jgi:hypothetical protein